MKYNSAEAIPDVPGATYDQLRVRFRVLAGVQDAVGAERKSLADEIKRREAEARARLRLGNLTAEAKAVYRRVIEGA